MGNSSKKIDKNIDELNWHELEKLEKRLINDLAQIKRARTKLHSKTINWEDVRFIQKQLICYKSHIEGEISINCEQSEFHITDIYLNEKLIHDILRVFSQVFTFIYSNQTENGFIIHFRYKNISIFYRLQKVNENHYYNSLAMSRESQCGQFIESTNMITSQYLGPFGYDHELREFIKSYKASAIKL